MSDRNLLITILDTNPVFWGLQSKGLINKQSSASKLPIFSFNDCLSAVVGFINVYKTMNQNNAVVLIAAHNTKADYLYPNRSKIFDKSNSPWEKYEQIGDIDEQIRENLKKLATDQLDKMSTEANNKDNLSNDTMVTSALGLGLCYINRIQQKYAYADTCNLRILVIKASEDSSNQYMNFMNMIFSAEKMNVVIDSCTLVDDSNLLQQASSLTNGLYFRIPQINGLLHYLLWLYLPDLSARKMLVYPPKVQVDYRAACFCHQKLIDVGYVCSVCLSVFCSFTPICTTCNTNFRFDVNMLKKASSLKQGLLVRQKSSGSGPMSASQPSHSATRLVSHNEDSQGANNLASQFQDAQISSPPDIESMDAVTSPVTNVIISTSSTTNNNNNNPSSSTIRPSSRASKNLDDSFDMLQ